MIQTSHLRTNDSLFFGGEIYSGWITFWGDRGWGGRNPVDFSSKFKNIIMNNRSASVYLAIGGTNFGLTGGSNGYQFKDNKIPKFRPQITSYDYDALIT
jgi:beta-galactosidase